MIIEQLKKISILYYLIFPKIFGIGYNQFKYHTLKKLIQNNKAKIKLNNYLDERMVEIPWVIKKLQKINNKYTKLKLLGKGELKKKVDIEVNFISKPAKDKVEKLGGKVTLIK